MAERRMFAKSVVESARFIRLPPTAQSLYFHLSMNADDDGVTEAYMVLGSTRAKEEDLKLLAEKGFVTILNDDLVTHITDWTRNNQIRSDRYHESAYTNLLKDANIQTARDEG